MNEGEQIINRRGIFIISLQLEGLCQSLRLLSQINAPVSPEIVIISQKLFNDFKQILVSGKTILGLPEPSETMSIHGLLTLAEVLRTSVLSFLSPDEMDDIGKTVRFKTQ